MSKFRRANTSSFVRGKISAPIIHEDDEFPIRLPGTAIATPLGKDSMERQRLQLRSSTGSAHTLQPDHTRSSAADIPRSSPSPTQPISEQPPRSIQPSQLRISKASMPSATDEGKPQRKKSSLGFVFRKLFGKKRKDGAASNGKTQDPGSSKAGQHRSDPTSLSRSPKDSSSLQKRSASLPINEFNRALRSHSTGIEYFTLQENFDHEPAHVEGRPRRATTPSRLWTPNRTHGYVDNWTGLSPRPASTQARNFRSIADAESDGFVGIAITSGSHPNRRSRSLGELRGTAPQNIISRCRSDEIRYWRESYDPGLLSPLSSTKADAEEPIQLPEVPHEDLPRESFEPFNFGQMEEMAGMKITTAASLETRVQRLEDRVHQVERGVVQLHRGTSREPLLFHSPQKRPSRDRSASINRPRTEISEINLPKQSRYPDFQLGHEPYGRQTRSSSYGSSRPSTNPIQNQHTSSFDNFSHLNLPSSEEQMAISAQQASARPLSTSTTIRGLTPTLMKDPLTGEHWTALTSLLLAEQAARQHLERLVHDLQQQVHIMRNGGFYPTPESEHRPDPMKSDAGGQSTFEADDSSDDEGRYAQENFQTPDEESGRLSDDIFGNPNLLVVKNPLRTLSLSQLTLGRGVTPSVEM